MTGNTLWTQQVEAEHASAEHAPNEGDPLTVLQDCPEGEKVQESMRSDGSAVQESARLACGGTGFISRKHEQQE